MAEAPFRMNHAAAVTPSDTVDLPAISEWLSFVNSGALLLTITTPEGEKVGPIVVPTGMWPIRARRVWATGTSVTSIFEYW